MSSAPLTFIVSTFERPQTLLLLLNALQLQTEKHFECIVTDNSTNEILAEQNEFYVKMCGSRFRYLKTNHQECYSSAEEGVKLASGRFLCFPSDDNYYLPQFAELMLRNALNSGLDLVYCDCVYGRPNTTPFLLDVKPKVNHIDKGGFLVAREVFKSFPGKAVISCSDGWLIEELVKKGVRHGKCQGILWVHN